MSDLRLDLLFTEEQVEKAAGAILDKAREGVTKALEEASDTFYERTREYLYEHFQNGATDIRRELVCDLAAGFAEQPRSHEFEAVRNRLWREHRDEILAAVVADRVKDTIWSIVYANSFTSSLLGGHRFEWIQAIVKAVKVHWREFEPLCQEHATRELMAAQRDLAEAHELAEHRRRRMEELEAELLRATRPLCVACEAQPQTGDSELCAACFAGVEQRDEERRRRADQDAIAQEEAHEEFREQLRAEREGRVR